jgi:hypothetical protein
MENFQAAFEISISNLAKMNPFPRYKKLQMNWSWITRKKRPFGRLATDQRAKGLAIDDTPIDMSDSHTTSNSASRKT